MNATLQNSFVWSGREDTEETGPSFRWHQKMQPLTEISKGGVTLIGFCSDEGVRRNKGRPGAVAGPQALRAALTNLPIIGEPDLYDAGDVICTENQLEEAQSTLAKYVAQSIGRQSLPIVLGGGHEVAWGSFQGIAQTGIDLQRVMIVNFDAHFDLRLASSANSGTPFRQMQEFCAEKGSPFTYRVFGISQFSNTQALFDRADEIGVRYWVDEKLQFESDVRSAQEALKQDLERCDAVYLTICLDVLPGASAPGVSAPAALGVPLASIEFLIDEILASGKLIAADIAELNPEMDRDHLTAKVAARLVARIAHHQSQ